MFRITHLMVFMIACVCGNAGLLLAGPTVVVGAGSAEQPRTENQLEFAIAAAVECDGSGNEIAGGLFSFKFVAGAGGAGSAVGEVVSVQVIPDSDGNPDQAVLEGRADVKFSNGRRFSDVEIFYTISLVDESRVSMELDLAQNGVVRIDDAIVSSGGNHFGVFEPEMLVVSQGETTTVESIFQAAAAIGPEGEAMGQLSLLANRDNGDLVRVQGVADGAAVGPNVGRKRLQLYLSGVAAVDVFRPDGTSPDTCFGDFTFVANEGPHGPLRIDVPDCRDPLAGIEGSDLGSGGIAMTAADWPLEPIFVAPGSP